MLVAGRIFAADIPAPQIPDHVFTVTDYGAVGDGKTMNTEAIAKTIAACVAAGGGRVSFPAGNFLTGPFVIQSNMDLHVEKGASVVFSDDPTNYKLTNRRFENCILAQNCHDILISGEGTIDGQGAYWWHHYVLPKNSPPATTQPERRPNMIALSGCQRVRVEGVTLTNSPMFHLVPQGCQDVTIDGIKIIAPGVGGPNTDGIDPSGYNFHILNCMIDVGDDCIAIKPSRRIDPNKPSCLDFLIEDCTFLHGHGMSIGNPTPGGLKNLTVRNCTFDGTDCGIRMKTSRLAGGIVEDCTYDNLKMKNVKTAILITDYYPSIPLHPEDDPAQTVGPNTPIFRHIHISNVTAVDSMVAGQLIGVAEMPLSDIMMDHVNISAKTGMRIVHAKDIKFTNSSITTETGPATTQFDAQVTGLTQ